ncbi:MAG: GntR family transcriptional regulator [Planctomycetota bacterium]|jgi:DNA-binding LacI/PurR family transcriptional regulator|nr:GntR family transcriptional regulator [Planctomycetota bacterium]
MPRGRPSLVPGVVAQLVAQIESGAFPAGAALPGEAEFAAQIGVSRPTLRRALAVLDERGLVERHPGKGTFVRDPQQSRGLQRDRGGVRLIGIDTQIVSDSDDYYRLFLDGILAGLGDLPHRIVMLEGAQILAEDLDGIDALAVMGLSLEAEPVLARLAHGGLPVVLFNRQPNDAALGYVAVDYRVEAEQGTQALIAAGHRRLCYVGKGRSVKGARLAGYRAACAVQGIEPMVLDNSGNMPAFAAALRAAITDSQTEALFAEDMSTAARICTALSAGGPQIGRDIEMLCFDRCGRTATEFAVPISEIRMPQQAMGARAGGWLREVFLHPAAPTPPPRELFAAELLFRSTRTFARLGDTS